MAMLDTAITATADIGDKALVRSFSYIGGKWRAAGSGETLGVNDQATGDFIGEVAMLSAEESAGRWTRRRRRSRAGR